MINKEENMIDYGITIQVEKINKIKNIEMQK